MKGFTNQKKVVAEDLEMWLKVQDASFVAGLRNKTAKT